MDATADPTSVHVYSDVEKKGMLALTTAGGVSCLSIIGLVVAMMIVSIRSRRSPTSPDTPQHHFVRTHVGIYFLSLLLCDFAQSIASLISIDWILKGFVNSGSTCTAQGIIYQFGNVGSALWSLTIAVHTFALLFLRLQVSDWACFSTFVGVWVVTGSIVAIGPTLVQNQTRGPFHGLSGPWCWITEEYSMSRLGLEYFWMFFSAFFSFVLYTLVFLRLRGNILLSGWSLTFRCVDRKRAWRDGGSSSGSGSVAAGQVDSHVLSVARQMLYYPVAYTIVILPVAICRWTEFTTGKMPLAAVFATDTIFLLSGFVNVVLFTTTRRVIPKRARSSSLPVHTKSSKDVATFMGSANGHGTDQNGAYGDALYDTSMRDEMESPTTSDEDFATRMDEKTKKRPSDIRVYHRPVSSSLPSPPELPAPPPTAATSPPNNHYWSVGATPPAHQTTYMPPANVNGMFFAPSSPSLHSSVSISFSEVNPMYILPQRTGQQHQTIPTLIMTPPSPSPSQRSVFTANTVEREREIAEAAEVLPALTRF